MHLGFLYVPSNLFGCVVVWGGGGDVSNLFTPFNVFLGNYILTRSLSSISLNSLQSDMKLGRNMARTFLDYYKLLGYISTKPSSGLNPKPTRGSAKDGGAAGGHHRGSRYNDHKHGGGGGGRAMSEPVGSRGDSIEDR